MAEKVLRPHQQAVIDELRGSLRKGHRRIMVQASVGFGKCLGLGTPVVRYDGRRVPVETLVPGDILMGPDSRPRTVQSVCRGKGPLYLIKPLKGEEWVCNDVHVLTLVDSVSGSVFDVPLNEFLEWPVSRQREAKLFFPRLGVVFQHDFSDPEIPGYFAGLWIGDGSKNLKGVAISKPDREVLDECERVAEMFGCEIRTDGTSCPTHHLVTPRGQENTLLNLMRRYFSEGRIGQLFRSASYTYRLNLLAGILDSDGHLVKGTVFEVAQKSRSYAETIVFIARSLGMRVTQTEKVVNGTTYYRIHISGDTHRIPTRIVRKQATARRQKKDPSRTGFRVEAIGEGEYAGFTLDGDGRFLLGDFTVTHNTVVASSIIRSAYAKGNRSVFCVPSIALIGQTIERLVEDGFDASEIGVIQADHEKTDWKLPIQIASHQTLSRRSKWFEGDPKASIVMIDEAHLHANFYTEWMRMQSWLGIPFIGLSGTPWTRGLGRHYSDLIIGKPMPELIEEGYLSKFRVFASSHPDLTGVRKMAGDFHEGDLSEVMSQKKLIADIVENWLRHGEGRPTFCFCVDRKHAQKVQAEFAAAGVKVAYVDAFTGPDERKAIQNGFAIGDIQVVCNVGVLTTGVDWDVRCIIFARPTRSEMLFVQIIGRGLRTAGAHGPFGPKEDCLIFDHSDNHLRLGFATDIVHEELDKGEKKRAELVEKERLPKECPQCKFVREPKIAICPNCGFQPKVRSQIECDDGELEEITPRKATRKDFTQEEKQRWYSMLLFYARKKGYSPGWVAHKYKNKFTVWPRGMLEVPIEPDPEVMSWIRHVNIKSAAYRKRVANDLLDQADARRAEARKEREKVA